jgi:hypothetical protein
MASDLNKKILKAKKITGEFYEEKDKVERLIDELLTAIEKRSDEIKTFCDECNSTSKTRRSKRN